MLTRTIPSSKEIDKTLKKSIKKVIHQRGITQTTRKGSKELSHLTRRIAQEPFENLEAVDRLGEQLGAKIAEATQHKGGDRLYQGTIRQLVLDGAVQSLVSGSTATLAPQEEAAIDTTALPTETSGEPEAEISQEEPIPQASPSQDEDSEPSSTVALEEDSTEEEVSEDLDSKEEDETN